MVLLRVIVVGPGGSELIRIGLLARVGALAVNVSVPIVTVAPPAALFAETVPIALAFVPVPSEVVPVVQEGVTVPLSASGTPHSAVHSWMFPLVSTISAFAGNAVDGVQGPGVVPVRAVVMLKLMTQPPAVVNDAPHEVEGALPKSQSVLVLAL
jgi:hypothetical protein